MLYVNISRQKWHIIKIFRKNGIVRASESSSGAQISCSGACSSSSSACISSIGQRLQSLTAPEALFFSRGLAFSPSGATTLPHINHACVEVESPILPCKSVSVYMKENLANFWFFVFLSGFENSHLYYQWCISDCLCHNPLVLIGNITGQNHS